MNGARIVDSLFSKFSGSPFLQNEIKKVKKCRYICFHVINLVIFLTKQKLYAKIFRETIELIDNLVNTKFHFVFIHAIFRPKVYTIISRKAAFYKAIIIYFNLID